jgi:hypothetical protein
MRSKYILIAGVLLGLGLGFGAGRLSAAGPLAPGGTLDSPGPPESTYWYMLEDIYSRLRDGTAGAPSGFTEPTSGPTAGTGHTLNEIMAIAPALDSTNGATQTHVLAGRTFWGLTSGQWGLITGTAAAAPVPKTGQTQCYGLLAGWVVPCPLDGYPGQDGDYQKGVTWPSPRFITSTAGIVTDTLTGLIWLQDANCFGQRAWPEALTDAATLNSGECGLGDGSVQGDWRLPNIRELQSLFHYGFRSPAVSNTAGTGKWSEGDPFTDVQGDDDYWSSTTCPSDLDVPFAYYVNMGLGTVSYDNKGTTYYVWPVRGGQ